MAIIQDPNVRYTAAEVYAMCLHVGFDPQAAQTMTAIVLQESGGRPGVKNSGSSATGLGQVLTSTHRDMILAYGQGIEGAKDPIINLSICLSLSRQGTQWSAWTVYTSGSYRARLQEVADVAASGQYAMPADQGGSGVPQTAPETAVSGNQITKGGVRLPAPADPTKAGIATVITADGQRVNVVLYDLNGAKIFYLLDGSEDISAITNRFEIPEAEFHRDSPISGGSAQAFANWDPRFSTFNAAFDYYMEILVSNPEARGDVGIRRAILQRVARPDMGEAEFEALIRQTGWYQNLNDKQRQWDDLAEAEQGTQTQKAAEALITEYQKLLGKDIDMNDAVLRTNAREVASGNKTLGQVINSWIKPLYMADPLSPGYQSIADLERNRGKQGVDIENQAAQLREMYDRWGIQMSSDMISQKATAMFNNQSSLDDITEEAKDLAKNLYAGKPREIDTQTWAQPYIATYQKILERPDAGMFAPDVQRAMTQQLPVFEFEQQLKSKDEWLTTENAQTDITKTADQVGKLMGFS